MWTHSHHITYSLYHTLYTIHFIYYSNRAAVQLKCHGARYPVYVFVFICIRTWSKNGQPISMCFSKRKCYKKKRIEIGRFFMWKHFNIDFNFNIYPPQILNKIIGSFCFQSQRRRERAREREKMECLSLNYVTRDESFSTILGMWFRLLFPIYGIYSRGFFLWTKLMKYYTFQLLRWLKYINPNLRKLSLIFVSTLLLSKQLFFQIT